VEGGRGKRCSTQAPLPGWGLSEVSPTVSDAQQVVRIVPLAEPEHVAREGIVKWKKIDLV
jgi:hypothetical protein